MICVAFLAYLSLAFNFIFVWFLFFLFFKPGEVSLIINEKGCLQAGEEWLEMNLVTVAGAAVGIAFLQV